MILDAAIDNITGNFESVHYLLLNSEGQILVELRDNGTMTIPSDFMRESDTKEDDKFAAACSRILDNDLTIVAQEKRMIWRTVFMADEKRFNGTFFVVTSWQGEVPKINNGNIRLMWVDKHFAKNVLSSRVDREVLGKL